VLFTYLLAAEMKKALSNQERALREFTNLKWRYFTIAQPTVER
jgi:hypothetical protein